MRGDLWGARAQQLRRRLSGKLHCEVAGNERADTTAKQAAELPQIDIPVDISTFSRAVARTVREATIKKWPAGWFRSLMGDHLPPPSDWTGTLRSSGCPPAEGRALVWRPVLPPQNRTLPIPDTERVPGVQQ